MIYEYRVYEVMPGRMQDLHTRFRDHTLAIFERYGMKTIAFFTPEIGASTDKLVYILGFDSLEHREKAWTAFHADAEWQQARAQSEVNGPLVAKVTNTLFKTTDYSPLR